MRIQSCRLCKSEGLTKFLDLGMHPPSDAFIRKEQLAFHENKYPVDVYLCKECGLVQLGYIVPPELMFNKEYVYLTSISKTADKHFEEYAKDVMGRFCSQGDFVVEIGSNDGTLLKHFKNMGAVVLGVDPSRAATIAIKNSIDTINDFFSEKAAKAIASKHGKAKVIVGANVFAHINDLDDIMRGVEHLLEDDGIFVTEFPYLLDLVQNLEFDTIYHEHLSYFSIRPLLLFFRTHGMELFDVLRTPVHGGSVRLFVKKKGNNRPVSKRVEEILEVERGNKLYAIETYREFAGRVEAFRTEFVSLLKRLKSEGAKVAGNGAPAKGNTLLNYCQIGPELIEFIAEMNPLKHYTYTPGMHIPVLPLKSIEDLEPDYLVILPWNLKDDIIRQCRDFSDRGGKFIIPLPEPVVV